MAKKKTAKKVASKNKKKTTSNKKAAKKVTKKAAKKVTKKASKKVAKKTTKKVAKKVSKKTVKKVAKKTAKKAPKKVAKKATKKVAKKVAKKAAKKVTKKVAKKAVKKTTTKVSKKVTKKPTKQTPVKKVPKKLEKPKTKTPKAIEKQTESKKVDAVQKKPVTKGTEKVTKTDEIDESLLSDDVLLGKKKLSRSDEKNITNQAKEKISEGIADLNNEYSLKEIFQAIKTLEFYTSDSDECLARGCENPATTSGYCRFHYISGWKDIKKRERILEEGQLQSYIESLVEKYPIKFIDSLISDLTDEKSFFAILKEMDIDADEESYEDIEEGDDDDQDIAFETKGSNSPRFEE